MNDNVSAESTEKGVANGRKAVMFGLSYDDPDSQDAMLRQLNASSPGDVIMLSTPPDYVILDVGTVHNPKAANFSSSFKKALLKTVVRILVVKKCSTRSLYATPITEQSTEQQKNPYLYSGHA